MFNTNLVEFFTGNTGAKYGYGFDGSSVISLPEILGIGDRVAVGGNYEPGRSLQTELVKNFKSNWPMIMIGVVGIPVAANVAMKLIRKPIILPANRMLKNVGLDVKI